MTKPHELEARFWKALKSDMTMMLGIAGVEEGHTRPMTAQLEADEGGPIWFFTAKDNDLVRQLRGHDRAVATFASKDHDVFASVHGDLRVDTDRAVIDRLWNRFVAAWYEGGKDDPKLALLRLDPDRGQVWADASSMLAGVKMFLGIDPKEDYKDKVAKVRKKLGEWESYRLVVQGNKIEAYLNGELVCTSDQAKLNKNAFIGLQAEGGEQAFKNLRIKELR